MNTTYNNDYTVLTANSLQVRFNHELDSSVIEYSSNGSEWTATNYESADFGHVATAIFRTVANLLDI